MAVEYKEFNWIDWIRKATNVYERLVDRESQFLFNARFSFLKNKSLREWSQVVDVFYDDWRYDIKLKRPEGIVIWGGRRRRKSGLLVFDWVGDETTCLLR